MKDLRRLVVTLVIGSFSVAALLGIIALLGGGELGETEGRVLLTTVIVGVESIAVLCYLAVAGKRSALVGLAGGVVSLVPFSLALWLTWGGERAAVALGRLRGERHDRGDPGPCLPAARPRTAAGESCCSPARWSRWRSSRG